jgi:hypothetical protein
VKDKKTSKDGENVVDHRVSWNVANLQTIRTTFYVNINDELRYLPLMKDRENLRPRSSYGCGQPLIKLTIWLFECIS